MVGSLAGPVMVGRQLGVFSADSNVNSNVHVRLSAMCEDDDGLDEHGGEC